MLNYSPAVIRISLKFKHIKESKVPPLKGILTVVSNAGIEVFQRLRCFNQCDKFLPLWINISLCYFSELFDSYLCPPWWWAWAERRWFYRRSEEHSGHSQGYPRKRQKLCRAEGKAGVIHLTESILQVVCAIVMKLCPSSFYIANSPLNSKSYSCVNASCSAVFKS